MMTLFLGRAPRWMAAAILGALGACAGPQYIPEATGPAANAPAGASVPSAAASAPGGVAGVVGASDGRTTLTRTRSRWVGASWAELPGWEFDTSAELWPALLRSCEKPAPDWARVCADAQKLTTITDGSVRVFLQNRVQPWRVEALDGGTEGLMTGYYEPLVEASRVPTAAFRIPLYGPPADLGTRKPYWTRQQLETVPAARAALRGREIAWIADPLDALVLQIQGSGRLQMTEADGSRRLLRVAFAAHNDQPYKSVGRWLVDQGELTLEQASWPSIKAWARKNPKRLNEMLWANPRMIFFREEALPDPALGPKGGQGVPLTPGRSIAVDTQSIPYGTPVWVDATEPLSATPLRRIVMAQDTGSAITGAVRADYFWGWGEMAEQQAGRMKQPLRLWVLWPRS